MKMAQRRAKLMQSLNIRASFVSAMIEFSLIATEARRMNISCENDPEVFKREALKYAKMFGDKYLHYYNQSFSS